MILIVSIGMDYGDIVTIEAITLLHHFFWESQVINNKISFTDATKVLESLFTNNIGTTEFQAMTEEFICDKLQE